MRITNVYIPRGISKFGLKPITMGRLGNAVVLAGRNGSGKTRFLNCLAGYATAGWGTIGTVAAIHATWKQDESALGHSEKLWWLNERTLEMFIQRHWYRHDKASMGKFFSDMFLLEFDSDQSPVFVHFVPKTVSLGDPRNWTPRDLQGTAQQIEALGVSNLHMSAPALVQAVQNRWWNATHPQSSSSDNEKSDAITRYEQLRAAIQRFMGTELMRSIDGNAELFGQPIAEAKLSDGQIILLQLCAAIQVQAQKLSNLIILMDEPENHLHPEAMLNAIGEIQKGLVDGQIWIATHSIPLLAHFDPDCIWWVEDGTVQHAGSRPEAVLRGLIGDDGRIDKLADFLGLPASLAANNFAYQCLLTPAVVQANNRDPQVRQIQRLIEGHRPQTLLRILDFGAGRGRLVSAIRESNSDKDQIKKRIDYFAFDISAAFGKECKEAIERFYGGSSGRYFNEEKTLRSAIASQSADIVVMCNVLHEIEPAEWLPLFGENGIIQWLLRPDGFLLIVEDTEMRIGEKAHQKGFIVLDTADIKSLFGVREAEQGFLVDDARRDGRLKAHLVPAHCVRNLSHESLAKTLKQVSHLAKTEIKRLRQVEPNYRHGRKHAYYVQQFANSELALETMR